MQRQQPNPQRSRLRQQQGSENGPPGRTGKQSSTGAGPSDRRRYSATETSDASFSSDAAGTAAGANRSAEFLGAIVLAAMSRLSDRLTDETARAVTLGEISTMIESLAVDGDDGAAGSDGDAAISGHVIDAVNAAVEDAVHELLEDQVGAEAMRVGATVIGSSGLRRMTRDDTDDDDTGDESDDDDDDCDDDGDDDDNADDDCDTLVELVDEHRLGLATETSEHDGTDSNLFNDGRGCVVDNASDDAHATDDDAAGSDATADERKALLFPGPSSAGRSLDLARIDELNHSDDAHTDDNVNGNDDAGGRDDDERSDVPLRKNDDSRMSIVPDAPSRAPPPPRPPPVE
jgi:hypothetical protein